ncbi:MAG: ABC transporter substrate-binding protein [Bacteriovorax sp.]|nr:ABC transporter substrate-binding protein [Bacteriovorax sp.]
MRTLILILTSVLLLGLAKNPEQNWNERMGKKMITVSINQIPAELDPTKLRLIEHFLLLQLFSQTLVRVDESGELVSYLAKRWEYDAKKKEYIFTLDPDARFSDGTPVTAQDVAWSLSRHFWTGSPSVVANYLKVALANTETIQVNHIHPAFKVINEHTFGIRLKSFYHPFLHVLSMPGFSITKYHNDTFLPVGSGPLKLEKRNEKNKLSFLKNNLFVRSMDLNQVTVLESTGADATKKMFADGLIDLALGVSRGNLNLKTFENTKMAITLSESLAILHAYFNTKGMFNNDDYRSTLSCLMSKAADEFANINPMLERLKSFFPNGVMPMQYYNQNSHCKVISTIPGTVKIMLSQSNFSLEFVEILERILRGNNIKTKITLGKPEEILASIKNKDYDIISFGYVGNFPDPDAFIDLLNTSSPMHAGEFNSKPLFDNLEKSRFESDLELRLSAYTKTFHEFEQKNYFVPLFRLKIPIVYRSELSFPNTKFRYEGELWRIFWKN